MFYYSCLCVALFSLINSVMFGTTSIFNAKRNFLSGIKYFLQVPLQDENYQKINMEKNCQCTIELRSFDYYLQILYCSRRWGGEKSCHVLQGDILPPWLSKYRKGATSNLGKMWQLCFEHNDDQDNHKSDNQACHEHEKDVANIVKCKCAVLKEQEQEENFKCEILPFCQGRHFQY